MSCSEFRATPTETPDNHGGVAIDFASQTERDDFLLRMEEYFVVKRFMNAADAFDTVKAYALEQTSKRN